MDEGINQLISGAGNTTLQLKEFAAFAEDLGSVLSTHMVAQFQGTCYPALAFERTACMGYFDI